MKVHRRRSVAFGAAGIASVLAMPRLAIPQDYPMRPIRLLVPFAAGGAFDLIAKRAGIEGMSWPRT